ncbi:MAG: heme biosynthesis HemY N-terminal domain-containing protein [Acidiferrobacterales bacterium]
MKFLIFVLIVLFASATLALAVMQDPGYVLIARSPWSVEMPLTVLAIVLVLGFGAFYALVRLSIRLWNTPHDVAQWRHGQRVRRAREALVHGLTSLAEGNWEKAEKQLLADIGHSETSLINYLAAAFAAQARGNTEMRDEYLALGHQNSPEHALATGMAQAQLQIMARQSERALATLTQLRTQENNHPRILELLARTYRDLHDWENLANLVPELRRRKALATGDIDALELEAQRELLMLALPSGAGSVLKKAWNAVPQNLRRHPDLVAIYAQHLMAQDAMDESEEILHAAINHSWNDELVRLYGRVEGTTAAAQLITAEGWLATHSDSPSLLLTLGRLAARNKLMDQARDYLEKSILLRGPAEAYRELAGLLEQRGEHEDALEYYRHALEMYSSADESITRKATGGSIDPRRGSASGITHYGY